MFYVLNFRTHRFHTCDTAKDVKDFIKGYRKEHPEIPYSFFEVINAFPDGTRMTYGDFMKRAEEGEF